jgi:ankyrin repeat protein
MAQKPERKERTHQESLANAIAVIDAHKQRKRWHEAAAGGDAATLAAMIEEKSAQPKAKDRNGRDALMLAALGAHAECVKVLLPVCSGRARDPQGMNALLFAIRADSVECAKLLLGVSNKRAVSDGGMTALMHAAQRGSLSCFELALRCADPKALDAKGESALAHALMPRSTEFLERLLPLSDALAVDLGGKTALFKAADNGKIDHLRLLLPHGGRGLVDSTGNTPLTIAAWRGHAECVRSLLATPMPKGEAQKETGALQTAVIGKRIEAAQALVGAGVSPDDFCDGGDGRERDHLTALTTAARMGREEMLVWLLALPGERRLASPTGETLLHEAARGGNANCVRVALERCDPRAITTEGATALMRAVTSGSAACVELLAPVSDAWAKDSQGRMAIDYLGMNNAPTSPELIDAIRKAMAAQERDALRAVAEGSEADWSGEGGSRAPARRPLAL